MIANATSLHEPVLRWQQLGVNFNSAEGEMHAVRGVNLTVQAGECLALVGESGSGKTQSMLAPFGLSPGARLSGEARFDHLDLCTADEAARNARRGRLVGFVFQDPLSSLAPHLTIGEQLAESTMTHLHLDRRAADARSIALLDRVRILQPAQQLRAYPHELSGGMRQRVMIAMAIACEPRLLIADEPTTALDVTVQAEVLQLLTELRHEHGLAMVFISHDLAVVAQVADRVAVMQSGLVVETGTVHDILHAPQHAHTIALAAAARETGSFASEMICSDSPLLDVEGMCITYPTRRGNWQRLWRREAVPRAVHDASLQLHAGQILGIVGESGSGKSTLVRTILGIGDGTAHGQAVWRGHALSRKRPLNQRLDMQMVFQDALSSLDPCHSMGAAVAEATRQRHPEWSGNQIEARTEQLLLACGLEPVLAQRWPHQLSGGQAQRAAIARALAAEPLMLACDEAVSALDATTRQQVLELLARLRTTHGLAILFVTHDLGTVRRFCDRVIVMCCGKIVESGPTDDVLRTPQHPYTRRLMQAALTLPNT